MGRQREAGAGETTGRANNLDDLIARAEETDS